MSEVSRDGPSDSEAIRTKCQVEEGDGLSRRRVKESVNN